MVSISLFPPELFSKNPYFETKPSGDFWNPPGFRKTLFFLLNPLPLSEGFQKP